MRLSNFDYHLPANLIARYPLSQRSSSRLLILNKTNGNVEHRQFIELPNLLEPGDLLILNDTKVIPARLLGRKETGGRVEVLIERILATNLALAHIKASKSPKVSTKLILENHVKAEVIGREDDLFELLFDKGVLASLEQYGHIPLPLYIARQDEEFDRERYQTVYARQKGAVAAPTAGLHFDELILKQLVQKGIQFSYLTLHVGAGTFQPVRMENILEHTMHTEYVEVSKATCEQIKKTKQQGKRVIAVGTTSVRALETACQSGELKPFCGDTRLFIYPGFHFHCIDAMITNFHLPKSTLLMLVCAFGGYENVMKAYQEAIDKQYRFYSYGDCMLVFASHV